MSQYAAKPRTCFSAVGYPSSTNSEPLPRSRPFNGTFTISQPGWQFASSGLGFSFPGFSKAVPCNTDADFE